MGTTERVELERVTELLKKHGAPPASGIARPPTPLSKLSKRGKPQPDADQDASAADTQFRIGMEGRRASAGVLANPVVTRQVILDKPILIWQYFHPTQIFVDSNIESMNSSAQIYVYTNRAGIGSWFTFHFLWLNENASPAVINIDTQLVFTGKCFAQARAGVFSGYKTSITLSAALNMLRNTGWGSDPLTGDQTFVPAAQQSQGVLIASLEAEGGHLFQGVGTDSESFAAQPFDLSCNSFLVPAGASVIFWVSLYPHFSLEGDTLEDVVSIDFANDGRAVRCPFVALTVQTPT